MKLVKQKESKRLESPYRRQKKLKISEKISDVSDVEPAPKTVKEMFNCSLQTNSLEIILDRL